MVPGAEVCLVGRCGCSGLVAGVKGPGSQGAPSRAEESREQIELSRNFKGERRESGHL